MAAMVNLSDKGYNVGNVSQIWATSHISIGVVSQVIAVAGFIGNVLVVAVMLRPMFRWLNISIYLMALGLADGGALLFRFLSLLPVTAGVDFLDDLWGCRVVNWFRYSLHMIASWLLVAVSIERAIVITKSTKTNFQCKRGMPIGMTIGIVLVTFIVIGGYTLGANTPTCTVHLTTKGTHLPVVFIGIAIHTAIPAFILSVTNTVICVHIYKHHRVYIWTHLSRRNSTNSFDVSNKVTWMLMLNSCGFVLLTVPQVTLFVYLNMTGGEQLTVATRGTVELLCRMLDTINHSINPLLYTLAGSLYRTELAKLFRLSSIKRTVVSLQVFTTQVPTDTEETETQNKL